MANLKLTPEFANMASRLTRATESAESEDKPQPPRTRTSRIVGPSLAPKTLADALSILHESGIYHSTKEKLLDLSKEVMSRPEKKLNSALLSDIYEGLNRGTDGGEFVGGTFDALQEANESLTQELKDARRELNSTNELVERERRDHADDISNKDHELSEKDAELRRFNKELKELKLHQSKEPNLVHGQEDEVKKLSSQVVKKEAMNNKLQEEIRILIGERDDATDNFFKSDECTKRLRLERDQQREELHAAAAQIAWYKTQVEQLQNESDQARALEHLQERQTVDALTEVIRRKNFEHLQLTRNFEYLLNQVTSIRLSGNNQSTLADEISRHGDTENDGVHMMEQGESDKLLAQFVAWRREDLDTRRNSVTAVPAVISEPQMPAPHNSTNDNRLEKPIDTPLFSDAAVQTEPSLLQWSRFIMPPSTPDIPSSFYSTNRHAHSKAYQNLKGASIVAYNSYKSFDRLHNAHNQATTYFLTLFNRQCTMDFETWTSLIIGALVLLFLLIAPTFLVWSFIWMPIEVGTGKNIHIL